MTVRSLLSSLVFLLAAGAACGDELTAQQVVEQTVSRIATEVNSRRPELTTNKKELYSLIDHELLPQFDTDYAGRLVLGKNWRDATPEQRKRFGQGDARYVEVLQM